MGARGRARYLGLIGVAAESVATEIERQSKRGKTKRCNGHDHDHNLAQSAETLPDRNQPVPPLHPEAALSFEPQSGATRQLRTITRRASFGVRNASEKIWRVWAASLLRHASGPPVVRQTRYLLSSS